MPVVEDTLGEGVGALRRIRQEGRCQYAVISFPFDEGEN